MRRVSVLVLVLVLGWTVGAEAKRPSLYDDNGIIKAHARAYQVQDMESLYDGLVAYTELDRCPWVIQKEGEDRRGNITLTLLIDGGFIYPVTFLVKIYKTPIETRLVEISIRGFLCGPAGEPHIGYDLRKVIFEGLEPILGKAHKVYYPPEE